MTNDEITVVIDYLDDQIQDLKKQVKKLNAKLDSLETTASNAEAIALTNQLKGLF